MNGRSPTQVPWCKDWHFWIGFIQTAALVGAVVVALSIGKKQNALVTEQNIINQRMFELNQSLMELTLQPSVHVIFEKKSEKLQLMNFGKGNLWVKTVQVGDGKPIPLADEKMLVVPTAPYVPVKPVVEFSIKDMKEKMFQEIGQDGVRRLPYSFLFENFDGEEYVLDVTVNFIAKEGVENIIVQVFGATPMSGILTK